MPSLTTGLSISIAESVTKTAGTSIVVAEAVTKTASADVAVAELYSTDADMGMAIAESVIETADADVAIAEAQSMSSDLGTVIAEPMQTDVGLQIRIVDERAQLLALDMNVVGTWEYAKVLASRNLEWSIRLSAKGDSVAGIVLGDPKMMELHRNDNGDLVRCSKVECDLCAADNVRRATTAVNFYVIERDSVRILICDERLSEALATAVEPIEMNRAVVEILNIGQSSFERRDQMYKIEVSNAYFDESFWAMIDALELLDIDSISDSDLIDDLF